MKILIALTYYRPHVSGLTIYVERLARALAERGHAVTVLTSHYDRALSRDEMQHGVHVVRVPVALRVSKGVLMPTFGLVAARLARRHDVLSVHLPQFEAAGLALLGRWLNKPVILTYHCDLRLPPGLINRVADRAISLANGAAARLAHRIVSYTQDYVDHSPFLSRFREKIVVIPPPVVIPNPSEGAVATFRGRHALGEGPLVGFAARFATEKGVEFLVAAVPELLRRFPSLKVLFAGPYGDVIGEGDYWRRLRPRIQDLDGHWEFLGTLSPTEMASFFGSCDLLVVPSLNSTESFGLVQVEAMLCGTPVVAADLPGVRQPVNITGMGAVVPVGDAHALAAGVREVLEHRDTYVRPREEIERLFDIEQTVQAYEELFERELA